MNTSSQTPSIARTRDALDLVRTLAIHNPELPAPYITLHTSTSVLLGIQVDHGAFEAWREALAMDADLVRLEGFGTSSQITVTTLVSTIVSGRRVEVMVNLYGVGLPALPDPEDDPVQKAGRAIPVVTLAEAVSLMGALPMPTGDPLMYGPGGIRCGCGKNAHSNLVPCQPDPTPGELAEQRHLLDPLDHVLENLADERPAVAGGAA